MLPKTRESIIPSLSDSYGQFPRGMPARLLAALFPVARDGATRSISDERRITACSRKNWPSWAFCP